MFASIMNFFKVIILLHTYIWSVNSLYLQQNGTRIPQNIFLKKPETQQQIGRTESTRVYNPLSSFSGSELIRIGMKTLMDSVPVGGKNNVSRQCIDDIQGVFDGFFKRDILAMRMVDANGKPPPGIMDGNNYWLGSFDECIRIRPSNWLLNYTVMYKNATLYGQYCTASLKLLNWTKTGEPLSLPAIDDFIFDGINIGLCTPDTCSERDLGILLDSALKTIVETTHISRIIENRVHVKCKRNQQFDSRAILVMSVFALYGVFVLAASIYDVITPLKPEPLLSEYQVNINHMDEDDFEMMEIDDVKSSKIPLVEMETPIQLKSGRGHNTTINQSIFRDIMSCFSLYRNAIGILKTKRETGTFDAINGIKFISMTWVILGHSYVFSLLISSDVLLATPIFFERMTAQVIINALLSVDTFFTLSGILLSYFTLMEMKKRKGRINWFFFYIHRFWRLSPPYFAVMVINISLFKYLNNGALWPEDGIEFNYCKDSWWYNILYINNFYPNVEKQCMIWSWYLANDFQFFLVSPLLLVPLYYYRSIGIGLIGLLVLTSVGVSGVISKVYNLKMSLFLVDETDMKRDFETYFLVYYIKPYCRIGPFLVGMLTGYIMYKTKCTCKLSKRFKICAWSLSAILAVVVLYGTYGAMNEQYISPNLIVLYNATHRTIWGAAICWVVFACVTGNAGAVNTFLSWKAMIPFSRLTFIVYLVHPIIMWENNLSRRNMLYNTDQASVYLFLGNLVISYIVGFLLCLTLESPILSLEKVLLRRTSRNYIDNYG